MTIFVQNPCSVASHIFSMGDGSKLKKYIILYYKHKCQQKNCIRFYIILSIRAYNSKKKIPRGAPNLPRVY